MIFIVGLSLVGGVGFFAFCIWYGERMDKQTKEDFKRIQEELNQQRLFELKMVEKQVEVMRHAKYHGYKVTFPGRTEVQKGGRT